MYDCVIIGAGPAGLSAGIYASRAGLNTLILEAAVPGGQIAKTNTIENYPGASKTPSGPELIQNMLEQIESFGVELSMEEVVELDLQKEPKKIKTSTGTLEAKTVILATGASPRMTGAEEEERWIGRGVGYCATCDAPFYTDLPIYVIGGGDAAVEEALYLTKFGKKVTIIHRRDKLKATASIQEKAFSNPKIDFLWNRQVVRFEGDEMLKTMAIKNLLTGEEELIEAEDPMGFGVFVFVGYEPQTALFKDQIRLIDGYVDADETTLTNIPGVFAAGDLRRKKVRQVITAASDGAVAAVNAAKFIGKSI